ncbi:MAG TPA: hypothetical protein VFV85_08160 [Conexibacter sp.]|nr:hypothetical protein [Conexibacter sp.]
MSRRAVWLALLLVSAALGLLFALAPSHESVLLPRHGGWWVAGLLLIAGAGLGVRAAALPFAGFGVWGATGWILATVDPGTGEDQRALFVLFFTLFPAMLAVPALAGALVRALTLGVRARWD